MDADDHDLLRAYVRDGAQEAFAALVQRHLGLVFSAARRQVQSHDLAQDVTQLVFIALAREGRRIGPKTPVAAWLYLVTRRTALNLLRSEARRHAREQAALELAAMKSDPPAWPRLDRWLEEAMAELSQTDGSALLLRFFENKSLREVGAALGVSEDAAQKRISRALEQLRAGFARRGVAVTAAGLAMQLSAHAIEVVPAGVGAAVSSAVTVSAATVTGGGLATLFMTTLQKNALVATLALAAGAVLYEGVALTRQRHEIASAMRQQEAEEAELTRLRAGKDAAAARLAMIEREIDARLAAMRPPARDPTDTALLAEMDVWLDRVRRLDEFLTALPDLDTPELQLISREKRLSFVSVEDAVTEEDLRRGLAKIRDNAVAEVTAALRSALTAYVKAHDGVLPAVVTELAPFVSPRITPDMLTRFEVWQTGRLDALPPEERARVIALKPADVEFDSAQWIGPGTSSGMPAIKFNHTFAQQAFARIHGGRIAARAEDLMPYVKWPVSVGVLQKAIDEANATAPRRGAGGVGATP